MQLVRDQQGEKGKLAAQADLDQQDKRRGDGQHADDRAAATRAVVPRLVVEVDSAVMIGERVTPKHHGHQDRRDERQHGAGEHHVVDRQAVDESAARARTDGLRNHPLRGEQRKTRSAEP